MLGRTHCSDRSYKNCARVLSYDLARKFRKPCVVALCQSNVEHIVVPFNQAIFAQSQLHRIDQNSTRVCLTAAQESKANWLLLRPCYIGLTDSHGPKKEDEIPPPHNVL